MAKQYLPHDLKPWATDTNYAAGANPWNGQPTKVQPPTLLHASGLVPGTKLAAEYENWLKSRAAASGMVQLYQTMNGWSRMSYTLNVNAWWPFVSSVAGPLEPDTDMLFTLTQSSDWSFVLSSGTELATAVGLTGITGALGAVPSANAEYGDRLVWASSIDRDVGYQPSFGTQSLVSNVVPAGFGVASLHLSTNGSKRLLLGVFGTGSTTQRIFTSDNGGTSWTPRTTPSGWNTTHIWRFADNGAGTILATGNRDNELLRSTDNGVTWAVVTPAISRGSTSADACFGLAWSPVHGVFMIAGLQGGIATSQNGATWNTKTSPNFRAHATGLETRYVLAANGPVFAMIFNQDASSSSTHDRRGVAWTVDAGASWRFSLFGNPNSDQGKILGVSTWNGRFIAWSGQGDAALYATPPLHVADSVIFP